MTTGTTVEGVPVHWEHRRELFSLDPATAYLNHGAFGAVPRPVQRAQQRLRDEVEADPMAFFTRGLVDRLGHTRSHLARFVGAPADGVALVPNATAATAVVLGSLALQAGQEILVTDHAYGALKLAAQEFAGRAGATVREVPIPLLADDSQIAQRLVDALRGNTRLVVIDHVTSPTAKLFPVKLLTRELHERGVAVLVDAAHAPGMLDVDVAATGADFWLGNLHKWAFTPRPTALLGVAPEHRAAMRPLAVSWEHPHGFPTALEFAGTLDYTAWLAAPTGVYVLRTLGEADVRAHNAALVTKAQRLVARTVRDLWPAAAARSARAELLERAAAGLLGGDTGGRTGDPGAPVSMRLVPLPPGLADDLAAARALQGRLAAQHRVEVAIPVWGGAGFLRLSAQIYNRIEDYERLCHALRQLTRPAA